MKHDFMTASFSCFHRHKMHVGQFIPILENIGIIVTSQRFSIMQSQNNLQNFPWWYQQDACTIWLVVVMRDVKLQRFQLSKLSDTFRPHAQCAICHCSANFYFFSNLKFATAMKQQTRCTLAWTIFTNTNSSNAASNHAIQSTFSRTPNRTTTS